MPASRRPHARRASYAAFLAAAVAGACTDRGGVTETPPAPPPAPSARTIGLTAAPAAVSVVQGQSGAVTVTLTRGGHGDAVTLGAAVAGSPAGVTASLAPATVPEGGTESVVTLATTPATPPGEHTVTITGAGGGANAAATVVLRVTAAPQQPAPSYALAVSPSPVTVTAGGAAGAATVTLARTHFAGAVTLAAAGAPAGLTVTAPNVPADGASAALGVQAAAAVAAGDYPITLTGTAAGLAPVTAAFVVRVAPAAQAPAEPGVVTGVALDARGRPLADVAVHVKMMFNPNVVRAHTGPDGRYTVRGLPAGLAHQAWAYHAFEYGGRSYCSRLAMPNRGDYDPFVPGAGAVRDFRWQLTGRIPDAGNNHFGASVSLALSSADHAAGLLEDGDDVEVTLTPRGPLVDGSEGAVVTRVVRFHRSGWDSRLVDIPHGTYTAEAARVRGGVRTPLSVGRLGSGQLAATAAVAWEPDHPGSCGQVLGPDLRTFELQLAGR